MKKIDKLLQSIQSPLLCQTLSDSSKIMFPELHMIQGIYAPANRKFTPDDHTIQNFGELGKDGMTEVLPVDIYLKRFKIFTMGNL